MLSNKNLSALACQLLFCALCNAMPPPPPRVPVVPPGNLNIARTVDAETQAPAPLGWWATQWGGEGYRNHEIGKFSFF